MLGTEAMTCQELLALSGALSAALPTGQLGLGSFFTSLSKGGTLLLQQLARTQNGGCRAPDPLPPFKPKFKKSRFCRHDYIKGFTLFTPKPKSATELGCGLLIWNTEN
jgi:hypothetical protein